MVARRSPKFFITHSWRDNNFARRLTDDLKAKGLDGFFDVYSIQPGDNIPSRISSGLDDCDVYIPVLSATAFQSPWCEWEINAAIQLRNTRGRMGRPRIIPVVIDDCHSLIPVILRPVAYIDFTRGNYADSLQRLLKGMGVLISEAARAATPASPPSAPPRATPPPSKRKAWMVVSLAAAMVGLVVLGMLFISDSTMEVSPLTLAPSVVATPTFLKSTSTMAATRLAIATAPGAIAPTLPPIAPTQVPPPSESIANPMCPEPQYTFISFPSNGAVISAVVTIRGTASIKPYAQPYRYALFYRPGIVRDAMDGVADAQAPLSVNGPNGKNIPIQVVYFQPYDAPVVDVVLGSWDTTKLASGWYSLRLWNKDRSGNYSGCDVYVYVR